MADSVGRIALDIDLRSSLNKEIKGASEQIGKQLTSSINQSFKRQVSGVRKMMTDAFKMPKKTFEMPKQTFNMQPMISENDRLSMTLNNLNQQIDIQRQKLADLKRMYNEGLSEQVKHQIEQQNAIMVETETRIESLRIKLKDLRDSYDNAVSPERKNKLLEEISKTEAQMTRLIARSDNALHKITQLEDGLAGEKRNRLREQIVKTEASLIRLGERADRVRNQMTGTGKGMQRVGRDARKTEKPVRRLGTALTDTGRRASPMTNSFVAGFKRIAKQVLVFAVIYKAIRGLQLYIGSAMQTNDQFMHSLAQVRTNLQVAFMPIFEAIIPALQAFMNWLAKVTTYIAAFISAIFGKTYQQSYRAAQGINNARNAMEGFGSASKKAAKDAEKAHKQLAGFDEINTIADQSAGAGAGGAGGAVGAGGIAPLTAPDVDITGIQKKMDDLAAGIKRTFNTAWDYIRKGWQWTVDTFGPSLQKGWSIVEPELEKWKGTFGRVFSDVISLGEPLANWFHDHLVPGWQSAIESYSVITATLLDVTRQIFESLWEAIFPIIQKLITDGLPVFTDFLLSAVEIFTELLLFTKEIFDSLWADVVDPGLKLISQIITDALSTVFDWWRGWGTSIVSNLQETFGKLKELWNNLWENFLGPYVSNMLGFLSDLWNEHFRELVAELGDFIGKLVGGALEIFNEFIMPIANWLTKVLGPVFQVAFSSIGGFVTSAIGGIVDVIRGLIKILGGLIDFIVGVFTGNWKRAWTGVKNIFKGIADSFVAIIKTPINAIIGAVNGAIRGLNKIKVPDWVPVVGGKGINLPQIPKLARGGIIDQPTLAMVGEAGTEAVMPLENNTGWINNLAGQIANQMGSTSSANDESVQLLREIVDVLLQILNALLNSETEAIFKLGETEFGRAVIRVINNLQTQSGKTLINV